MHPVTGYIRSIFVSREAETGCVIIFLILYDDISPQICLPLFSLMTTGLIAIPAAISSFLTWCHLLDLEYHMRNLSVLLKRELCCYDFIGYQAGCVQVTKLPVIMGPGL